MEPEQLRQIVDFGLAVLICLVQAVIYPTFAAIDPEEFRTWHRRYTRAISLPVVPLMMIQAALIGWQAAGAPGVLELFSVLGVIFVWTWTFAVMVPLHTRLQREGNDPELVRRLVRANRPRTLAWTSLFLPALAG